MFSKYHFSGIFALLVFGIFVAHWNDANATEMSDIKNNDDLFTANDNYHFAENLRITAIFRFPDGTIEWSPFQVFTQTPPFDESDNTQEAINNFNQRRTFDVAQESEFVLRKLVSDTPKLYKFADMSRMNSKTGELGLSFMDVDILLSQNGELLRSFDYNKCKIIDYFIETQFDKERGWTIESGHGFAVTDNFIISCDGYKPMNPLYDNLGRTNNSSTLSSRDLRNTDHWDPMFTVK